MHGMNNAKVINSQQARTSHHCKKIKKKIFKTNAAVLLKKMQIQTYNTSVHSY